MLNYSNCLAVSVTFSLDEKQRNNKATKKFTKKLGRPHEKFNDHFSLSSKKIKKQEQKNKQIV